MGDAAVPEAKVGAGGSLLTGNIVSAGAIVKLDNMIACYQTVGAVTARVYVDKNIAVNPSAPKVGVLAVINTTRIQRNLLNCVLNTGGASAQAARAASMSSGNASTTGPGRPFIAVA